MDYTALNDQDMRRDIIEYVKGFHEERNPKDLFEKTESKFEADVLRQMLQHGYTVQPQYPVGNYRIDFVVTVAPGYRLAVECDGDRFHSLDQLTSDIRRQRVLERLGWNFWRIRASEYYLDPAASMEPLWKRLEDLHRKADDDAHEREAEEEERGRKEAQTVPDADLLSSFGQASDGSYEYD